MSSISSAAASHAQRTSPLERLQTELASEVSASTVSTSDSDALSSAIKDIDSSLKSAGEAAQSSGTRPSPSDIKSKIDELIASQVSDGKLTSDQADELKNVFAQAFAKGPGGTQGGGPGGGIADALGGGQGGPGGGGHGGPGGPRGAGGPPPGGPPPGGGAGGPDSASSSSDSTDSTDDSSSSSSSTESDVIQLLKEFVKAVQNQLSKSSASYDSSGQNSKVTASLVVDYQS